MTEVSKNFTINIEPVGDHLEVTIPELGITTSTVGTTRTEAIDVATQAITATLLERKKLARKQRTSRQKQAS